MGQLHVNVFCMCILILFHLCKTCFPGTCSLFFKCTLFARERAGLPSMLQRERYPFQLSLGFSSERREGEGVLPIDSRHTFWILLCQILLQRKPLNAFSLSLLSFFSSLGTVVCTGVHSSYEVREDLDNATIHGLSLSLGGYTAPLPSLAEGLYMH